MFAVNFWFVHRMPRISKISALKVLHQMQRVVLHYCAFPQKKKKKNPNYLNYLLGTFCQFYLSKCSIPTKLNAAFFVFQSIVPIKSPILNWLIYFCFLQKCIQCIHSSQRLLEPEGFRLCWYLTSSSISCFLYQTALSYCYCAVKGKSEADYFLTTVLVYWKWTSWMSQRILLIIC